MTCGVEEMSDLTCFKYKNITCYSVVNELIPAHNVLSLSLAPLPLLFLLLFLLLTTDCLKSLFFIYLFIFNIL